jgi:hypothetical protein
MTPVFVERRQAPTSSCWRAHYPFLLPQLASGALARRVDRPGAGNPQQVVAVSAGLGRNGGQMQAAAARCPSGRAWAWRCGRAWRRWG